jgi:hypothetical protein
LNFHILKTLILRMRVQVTWALARIVAETKCSIRAVNDLTESEGTIWDLSCHLNIQT